MFHTVLLWLCLWCLDGVFGVEVKSVSVIVVKGDSVTLNTGVTEIQKMNTIMWRFGPNKSLIARLNSELKVITVYDDVPDGRFRDRLKLDNQTGSLTITNTRTTDSGLYKVTISGNREIRYRFTVTVSGVTTSDPRTTSHPSCPTSAPPCHYSCPSDGTIVVSVIVLISVVVGSLLIMAVTGLCCICRKHRDQTHEDKTDPTLYKLTGHMTESEMTEVIYTCFTPEQ